MYIKYPGKNYYKRIWDGSHLVSIKLKYQNKLRKRIREVYMYSLHSKVYITKTPLSQRIIQQYFPTLNSKCSKFCCGYKGKNFYLSSFAIRSKNRYTFSRYSYSQDTLIEAYFDDDFDDC